MTGSGVQPHQLTVPLSAEPWLAPPPPDAQAVRAVAAISVAPMAAIARSLRRPRCAVNILLLGFVAGHCSVPDTASRRSCAARCDGEGGTPSSGGWPTLMRRGRGREPAQPTVVRRTTSLSPSRALNSIHRSRAQATRPSSGRQYFRKNLEKFPKARKLAVALVSLAAAIGAG